MCLHACMCALLWKSLEKLPQILLVAISGWFRKLVILFSLVYPINVLLFFFFKWACGNLKQNTIRLLHISVVFQWLKDFLAISTALYGLEVHTFKVAKPNFYIFFLWNFKPWILLCSHNELIATTGILWLGHPLMSLHFYFYARNVHPFFVWKLLSKAKLNVTSSGNTFPMSHTELRLFLLLFVNMCSVNLVHKI